MLPDFGWSELLVIAIVLIVIVGPKDLPKMLRTFGKTTSSLRKMAGDFRRQFDDALKEAELDDVRQIANDLKGLDPRRQIKDTLSPLGKVGQDISGELKKAASEIKKSDKPNSDKSEAGKTKTDTTKPAVTADSTKAVGATSELADDLKPAAKAGTTGKTTKKPATQSKPTAKSASTRKTAAAKAPASKSASPSNAASTKTAAGTSAAKPKTSAARPKAAASNKSAASKTSAVASKSRTSTGQTKPAAKPRAATKTTKTAAKDQS